MHEDTLHVMHRWFLRWFYKKKMNQSLQHFKAACEKEFNYLIEEYGFTQSPLPLGKYINEFQFRLSNGKFTLVVDGIGQQCP